MSAQDIALKVFEITLHLAEWGSDYATGIWFISRGDVWWGGLTIFSVLLAMLMTSIIWAFHAISNLKWKKRRVGLLLICFPFVPLGTLVWELYFKVNQYKHARNSAKNNENNSIANNDTDYGTTSSNDQDIMYSNSENSNSTINIDDNIINNETGNCDSTSSNINSDTESLISIVTVSESNSDNAINTNGGNTNNSDNDCITTSDNNPPHIEAPAFAKLSESLTEAVPLACLSIHIIFYTLYVPGAKGAVDDIQWISLAISISYIAFSIAINGGFKELPIWKKTLVFVLLHPVITSRLMICGAFGTIHPALFLVPIGTEMIGLIATGIIWKCFDVNLCSWNLFKVVFSSIYIWFSIGGIFINAVPMGISITTLVLSIITCPIQTWVWKMFVT